VLNTLGRNGSALFSGEEKVLQAFGTLHYKDMHSKGEGVGGHILINTIVALVPWFFSFKVI
jgi:hypothetical protein